MSVLGGLKRTLGATSLSLARVASRGGVQGALLGFLAWLSLYLIGVELVAYQNIAWLIVLILALLLIVILIGVIIRRSSRRLRVFGLVALGFSAGIVITIVMGVVLLVYIAPYVRGCLEVQC